MDALLLDQFPIIPLYHQNQNYLVRPAVHGWVDNLLGWRRFQDYLAWRRAAGENEKAISSDVCLNNTVYSPS